MARVHVSGGPQRSVLLTVFVPERRCIIPRDRQDVVALCSETRGKGGLMKVCHSSGVIYGHIIGDLITSHLYSTADHFLSNSCSL